MAQFEYPGMSFEDASGEDGRRVIRCRLFARYSFDIPHEDLSTLKALVVRRDALDFPDASEKKVYNKVGLLVEEGLNRRLVHQLYRKPTIYLRDGDGIPLIGSTEIGVVDRGSNVIEIKPLTGCNFTCVYCSVDEGKNSKTHDYLIEANHLVAVAGAIAARKTHPVEFNIGPHGEPLLYPQLVELVRGLKELRNSRNERTAIISMNTNGSLLSEALIDQLAAAGMTRLNLSLMSLDPVLAATLAGVTTYPLQHILDMIQYARGKVDIILAPVLIPGLNEQEMARLVELSTTIDSAFPTIGIQNYLAYPKGRTPVKRALTWEEFDAFIKDLAVRTGKDLSMKKEDFRIFDEPELPKPFRKGDVVDAVVVMPGRYPEEVYAAATTDANGRARPGASGEALRDRLINVQARNDGTLMGKKLRVRIVRDKHNIYKAVLAGR